MQEQYESVLPSMNGLYYVRPAFGDYCFNNGSGASLASQLIEEIEELAKPASPYDSHPLIQHFPKELQDMIQEVSSKALLIPDYVATSMLTTLGSAIGNSLITKINDDYYKPILYAINIGDSSVAKSRVQDVFVHKPLRERNKELSRKYETEKEENAQLEAKEQREVNRKRVLLNKGTIEGVYKALNNNPKGILIYRDELSGWLSAMNKYSGKGDDVECYMELWKGSQFDNALSSKETSLIDNPFACVLGNTTPNKIADFAKNGNDRNGFLFRFLICYPDKPKEPKELGNESIEESYFTSYAKIYNDLCVLPFGDKQKEVQTSKEAFTVFQSFFKEFCKKSHCSKNENEQSIIGKMIDYAPRFALILQAIDYANKKDTLEQISELNMSRAVGIAKYYFGMAMKVQKLIKADEKQDKNSFTDAQIEFYESLPKTYKGSDMTDAAAKLEIKKATAYNWQKQFKDFGLIKELDYNLYQKTIQD